MTGQNVPIMYQINKSKGEKLKHFHNFLFVDAISIRREQLCARLLMTLAQLKRSVIKTRIKIYNVHTVCVYVSRAQSTIIMLCVLPPAKN